MGSGTAAEPSETALILGATFGCSAPPPKGLDASGRRCPLGHESFGSFGASKTGQLSLLAAPIVSLNVGPKRAHQVTSTSRVEFQHLGRIGGKVGNYPCIFTFPPGFNEFLILHCVDRFSGASDNST